MNIQLHDRVQIRKTAQHWGTRSSVVGKLGIVTRIDIGGEEGQPAEPLFSITFDNNDPWFGGWFYPASELRLLPKLTEEVCLRCDNPIFKGQLRRRHPKRRETYCAHCSEYMEVSDEDLALERETKRLTTAAEFYGPNLLEEKP